MNLRDGALLALLALGFATPAAAEMYRWTDAEGRDHYTMDLHRVPPEYRGQVKHQTEIEKLKVDRDPEPIINEVSTPDNAAVKRALRPSRRYGSTTSRAAAGAATAGCQSWQRDKANKLQRNLEMWEGKLELNEQRERRLVRTDRRLHAANRVAEYEIQRDRAAQAVEDFEDSMRQKGVPPGCYR